MFENKEPYLGLISYLSLSKLEQLYGNLEPMSGMTTTETSETMVKGDLNAKLSGLLGFLSGQASGGGERRMVRVREGEQNPFSKLSDTIANFRKRNAIADLQDCIKNRDTPKEAILYSLSATFAIDEGPTNTKYVEAEKAKEEAVPVGVMAESGVRVV